MNNTDFIIKCYHADHIRKKQPNQFYILTNDFNETVDIGNAKQPIPTIVYDSIIDLFQHSEINHEHILYFQNCSNKFIEKLNQFTTNFNNLYQLRTFINVLKKIKVNDYFFFSPADKYPLDLNLPHIVARELCKLNNADKKYFETYKTITDNYIHLWTYDNESSTKTIKTGNPVKQNRTCRFCGKREPETTFSHASHAISEGFGNKRLFCNEECDICNNKFGKTIEPSLLNYFNIERSFIGVKGKKNKTPNINLNYYRPHDCYRSMAKFFISLLPIDNFIIFYYTIKWINGSEAPHPLPIIWRTLEPPQYQKPFPKVSLFIQPDMQLNKNIPHSLIDFSFGPYRYLCTIPFIPHDNKDYSNADDFDDFWQVFDIYNAVKWDALDWSSEQKIKDQLNIKINFHFQKNKS